MVIKNNQESRKSEEGGNFLSSARWVQDFPDPLSNHYH